MVFWFGICCLNSTAYRIMNIYACSFLVSNLLFECTYRIMNRRVVFCLLILWYFQSNSLESCCGCCEIWIPNLFSHLLESCITSYIFCRVVLVVRHWMDWGCNLGVKHSLFGIQRREGSRCMSRQELWFSAISIVVPCAFAQFNDFCNCYL